MTDEPQHGRLEDLWSWIDSEDPAGETPLIEPAAVTAVMVVALTTLTEVAGTPSNVMLVAPVSPVPVSVTPLEFRLIAYLALHRDRVLPPTELLDHLYGDEDSRDTNALEAIIVRVRRKLGPGIVGTRRGFGYFLEGAA